MIQFPEDLPYILHIQQFLLVHYKHSFHVMTQKIIPLSIQAKIDFIAAKVDKIVYTSFYVVLHNHL